MVPSHFVQLSELPVTINGKVDLKRLPSPEGMGLQTGATYIAPRTQTEERLVKIWEDLLGREHISVKDNFFDLGGHSLKATRLTSQIHKEFQVKVELKDLFRQVVLEDQARLIDHAAPKTFTYISPAPLASFYPLSSSQHRLYILSQLEEGNVAYNMPGVYVFEGKLDIPAFRNALNALLTRHESLRTTFRENESGEVMQYINPLPANVLEIGEVDDETQLNDILNTVFMQPLDLDKGPLLRAALYGITTDRWVFFYVMHHIISDGWSMEIIIRELVQLYNDYHHGNEPSLPPLRIHYKDYAVWQQEQLLPDIINTHRVYWLQQLSGELPVLELPTDRPRPAVKTYQGGMITRNLDAGLVTAFKALLHEQACTLFMGALAAVNVLLHRYTNQYDLITGTPVAGRLHADLEDQIGFYLNTLALRTRLNEGGNFATLLSDVKQLTLDAFEHQEFPFDALVEALPQLRPDLSRSPIFDVMVAVQQPNINHSDTVARMAGLSVLPYEGWKTSVSKFDLAFEFVDTAEGLQLRMEYNQDIFEQDTAGRMANHLIRLMTAATDQPALPISQLPLLNEEEKSLFIKPAGDNPIIAADNIMDIFESVVSNMPQNIALVFQGNSYTYTALNEIANQLGAYLKNKYAVQSNERVGIKLPRNQWLVVAILGVMKSGAAYVPVDMDYPAERVSYMLTDSNCKVVIDEAELAAFLREKQQYNGSKPVVERRQEDIAYIIYTSGSTGQPKGVVIPHGNLVRFFSSILPAYTLSGPVVQPFIASHAFDISVFQLFLPLLSGGTAIVTGKETLQDMSAFTALLKEVNVIDTVPGVYAQLADHIEQYDLSSEYGSIERLFIGGDTIPDSLLRRLSTIFHAAIITVTYGPTEGTIFCTHVEYTPGSISVDTKGKIIGKGMPGRELYILSDAGAIMPVGGTGQICIGGEGLAIAYLNQPDLTTEKYVPHPFSDGALIYKTGDYGKWLPDGSIEFAGRRDEQVKIRGFRIELGEIERAMESHNLVKAAVVKTHSYTPDDKVLVAYIVGSEALEEVSLRDHLSHLLPAYMHPAFFIRMDTLPLTPNGKIDRKRLPALDSTGMLSENQHIAPRTAMEERLAAIWSKLLNKEQIGVKDDFFRLGGHSLKVNKLASSIHKIMGVKPSLKALFQYSTLEGQAALIARSVTASYASIQPAELHPSYPLSSSQRRLWILSQFETARVAYNMPGVYELEGDLDIVSLQRAFHSLLKRHESLRTVFREDEQGEPRQHILKVSELDFHLQRLDLRDEPDAESQLVTLLQELSAHVFDLSGQPLLRASLYRLANKRWVLSYVIHHIISDGWSMGILIEELQTLYNAYSQGLSSPLPKLKLHYKDYTVWQQEQLKEGVLAKQRTYWTSQFSGELPVLSLEGDHVRPPVKTFNGGMVTKEIDAVLTGKFRSLLQDHGATLFMGLLSAVNVLLYRYTQQEDQIIGTPIAGRWHEDLDDQIGLYLNTLALRSRFKGSESYIDLLLYVVSQTLSGYEHQSFPFDELIDSLSLQRDMSRSALFDVMVILQNVADVSTGKVNNMRDLQVSAYNGLTHGYCKFDLIFSFTEQEDALLLTLEYNSDIYNAGTARQLADHLTQLLLAITATPHKPLHQLTLLHRSETDQLLHTFNQSTVVPFQFIDKTPAAVFTSIAATIPDASAVVFNGQQFTFRYLHEQSNRLAAYLRDQYNIHPDDRVGIILPSSEWQIIAMLAILKSGAAYVPVDVDYPAERITYMLTDSSCKAVINENELQRFEEQAALYSNDDLLLISTPRHLAYVIYTSGSTGRPKGVMIEQHALLHYITTVRSEYDFTDAEHVLQISNIAFDAATEQIWLSLLSGATLHIPDKRLFSTGEELTSFIKESRITHLHAVPALLQQIDFTQLSFLKRVVSAGDAFPVALLSAVKAPVSLFNKYGPTECTISSTIHKTSEQDALTSAVPIGHTLSGTEIYITDPWGNLVPIGVTGEINISGAGLARGYLNISALTDEKFIPNPFRREEKMYRTGDVGKWLPEGRILFAGRQDEQIKIRGHRIELGEVENVLLSHPDIESAVVVARMMGDEMQLIAYIRGRENGNAASVRNYLSSLLPAYMLPAYYMLLDTFPLTPNGKIDKKNLPLPGSNNTLADVKYVPPRNETEEQLVLIWQEILNKEKLGILDNFFESGGHSLKVMQLISRIKMVFQVKITIQQVFSEPTIEGLANCIGFVRSQQNQKNNKEGLIEIYI
jgi:amino acid adenylation domain-containing protein